MKRRDATSRPCQRAVAAAGTQIAELYWLAPAVMVRRLAGLQGAAPWQALIEWQRWAWQKAFAFSESGLAMAQWSARTALDSVAGAASPLAPMRAVDQRIVDAARVLAPVRARVRRNARRR